MLGSGHSPVSPVLAAVLLVAGSVAATGGAVVAFGSPSAPTAPALGTDAGDAYAAVDGVRATRTTVVERGDTTRRTVAEVAFRPGTDYRRVEVTETTDRRHELVVSNGSAMTLYDRDTRIAKQFSLPDGAAPSVGERVERLFTRLNLTREGDSASVSVPGVSPLPVVPHGEQTPAAASGPLTLTYEGTASVDDRDAYVLGLAGENGSVTQRLWVDTTHFLVLKERTSWTDDGERVTVTTTYSDVSVGAVAADAFRFDPPANATVERLDTPERTAYADADALRAATDASVPRPDVPGSFRLTAATETTGEVHGVGLRYANETATLTVAKYNRTFPSRGDETVEVAGREAGVRIGPTSSVSWNCGDYRYTVRGQGVPVDVLVAVARSVACQ